MESAPGMPGRAAISSYLLRPDDSCCPADRQRWRQARAQRHRLGYHAWIDPRNLRPPRRGPRTDHRGEHLRRQPRPARAGLHLAFVRSPLAHARITGIDTAAAAAAPGVLAVFTAADLDLPAHHGLMVVNPELPRPPLATDRVRFVGEAVAVVVAETKAAAVDAVELVEVDYDPLPAVVDPEAALQPGAPAAVRRAGQPRRRRALRRRGPAGRRRGRGPRPDGQPAAGGDADGGQRDRRAARCRTDAHELTIWVSTQMPHGFRDQAAELFGLDAERRPGDRPARRRRRSAARPGCWPSTPWRSAVARALGRPVSWVETRSENLVSMPHGRGQVGYYELGLTRDGAITGLRARVVADCGRLRRVRRRAGHRPDLHDEPGRLRHPASSASTPRSALTNTTPMGAFRGAGRPEATAYLERMMDLAADELGLDPAEIRRRNFLDPGAFPFTTLLRGALRHRRLRPAAARGAAARRLREAARGAGAPAARRATRCSSASGSRSTSRSPPVAGAASSARSPCTPTARPRSPPAPPRTARGTPRRSRCSCSDRLGIPMDRIRFVQSDTATVPRGSGTGGSRSLQMGGNAVRVAADDVLEQARRRAAELLEAAVDDVELTDDGEFGVAGVPSATLELGAGGHAQADGGGGAARRAGRPPGRRHLPVRRARVGGGGGHRDRAGHAAPARRRRRLRPHPQPAARRRPAARRAGPGHRAGAVRGGPLRRRTASRSRPPWPTTGCPPRPTCSAFEPPTPRPPRR